MEIQSEIKIYDFGNGDKLRVQSALLPGWTSLDHVKPLPNPGAFDQVCELYEKFILPKAPYLFGTLIFFSLPEDMDMPFPFDSGKGEVSGRLEAASIALQRCIKGGKFLPGEKEQAFIEKLRERGLFRIIKGIRPLHAKILPISPEMGLLSSIKDDHDMVCNSSFFTMDMFDIGSPYDYIGRPIGLCVKNGVCTYPPLFEREALLVRKDGKIKIEKPKLSDMSFVINGKEYTPGKNAELFERPKKRKAKRKGYSIAIAGNKVIAVCKDRKMIIPSAGFILKTNEYIAPGTEVVYKGFEDVLFGIQVGNSIIKDGVPTEGFISYFSNIRNPFKLPIPPSLYPLDFEKARAPRMAIGNNKDGDPVIVWAEGPGKFDDLSKKGDWSCGASLSEMALICRDLGLINAVNLDGGGSAQMIIHGKRSLLISDRHKEDNSEYERSIPIGLSI